MEAINKRSSPSSSTEAASERLGSSRSGTSRLRDLHSIEFRPASGRLPVGSGHCAAGSVCDDSAAGGCRLRVFCQRGCHSPIRCCAIGGLIPYQMIERLVPTLRLVLQLLYVSLTLNYIINP